VKTALTWLILAFSLYTTVYPQTKVLSRPGDEDYRVYDAVLAKMFAGDKVTFDTQSRVKQLIIRETTTIDFATSQDHENWEQVKNRQIPLSDELIRNFEKALKSRLRLDRSFRGKLPYILVSDREFTSIFVQSPDLNHMQDEWDRFYKRFPESGGYVVLSNVGYNSSRNEALVYFVHWCGTVCGTGTYIWLKKIDAAWSVQKIARMWIS